MSDGEEDEDFEGLEYQGRDDFEDEMLPDDDDAVEGGEPESMLFLYNVGMAWHGLLSKYEFVIKYLLAEAE